MDLTKLKNIKSLISKHGLNIKKFLGQNFLTSRTALEAIVAAANPQKNDQIIEVGPGLGVLTKELSQYSDKVISIELDSTLLPVLAETAPKAQIIQQDALQYTPPNTPYKLVANIPYYITSPLINHFLQADNPPTSITLLIQKEVAEKMCKIEPNMTVLSLQVALFGKAKIIKKVPSAAFHPAPKVDSAIIHIDVQNKIDREQALKILKLAKRAFRGRRKKLSNTLKDLLEKLQKHQLENQRPQHLSISDWQKLI